MQKIMNCYKLFFAGLYLKRSESKKAFDILSKSIPLIFPFFFEKSILSILIGLILKILTHLLIDLKLYILLSSTYVLLASCFSVGCLLVIGKTSNVFPPFFRTTAGCLPLNSSPILNPNSTQTTSPRIIHLL